MSGTSSSLRPARLGVALLAALAMAGPLRAQTAPPARLAGSLRRVFGPGLTVDSVPLDSGTVIRARRVDSLLGFAQVLNVQGKDQPITLLIAIDPDARLRDVDVLVYREPYGGEVAYEAWRRQFRGKTAADPLEVDRDIRGISGATISVNAVTDGIRRALANLTRWRRAGLLR